MATRITTQPPRLAGRFSYNLVRRNRPRTLSTWRVTSASPHTARCLANLLGGHPQPDPVSGQVEVITTTDSLDILLAGPEALTVRWERGARHACDGITQNGGRPCACPSAYAERRALAKQGRGCQPRAEARFRLQNAPVLGTFAFAHGDWPFVGLVLMTRTELSRRKTGHPVRARLALRRTMHRLHSGRQLAYTRPVITLSEDDRTPAGNIASQARERSPLWAKGWC